MTRLVLTVVGDDRVGLVRTLADTVAAHGGNWERSELAELAGAFAGIVLVEVPDDREAGLVAALERLDGLLRITTHQPLAPVPATGQALRFTVLGNDRPGIVREVSDAIGVHALSIDALTSRTVEAPMSGGTLFEATMVVRLPVGFDADEVIVDLERLAAEIQVDLTLV
ncbi:glycine cleavage system protein R [Microbacterium thalli]|uniref:Amino acid-binding ACT protein n=1 Tax=Microbacterium thalli TaxID=3027921 RepID=A0ABT5SIC2_9MICO|nr:ACT domain-containing protein [Microbacterium thalli]MDD7929992.1 amino acid-binding ACT protein [Microbacterium thalli]MDD7962550.1 amino acid-binding ACT protein [Microbacterium thalli]MDN8548682.1 ACT domain-containing protein [Microbacterium thalli]